MAPGPKHLTTGDALPPLQPGILRVYSMKFCPFADRARLMLHAKGIEHEVVNVNTWKKPEWFVEKNPKQLVPVLEKDGKIVYESIITAQYLEDIYPDKNPLIPKDPYQRARDAIILDHCGGKFLRSMVPKVDKIRRKSKTSGIAAASQRRLEEERDGFLFRYHTEQKFQQLILEDQISVGQLKSALVVSSVWDWFQIQIQIVTEYCAPEYRSKPGFLDYMLWPVFARLRASGSLGVGEGVPVSMETLHAWYNGMLNDPSVKSILHPDSAYQEFSKHYRTENTLFDEIETHN
ncbi:putative glutathione S-transferase omega-1 [Apostichopus japonicus]|uniref:Glutathione S-transferase omega n=1 Tax=Stichopus japonicus TaxID=307972 RepID=A0A2G8KVW8_STIJA|nr:putative glutathione S-transferase omega-1 [Apostichopus japonicus]